MSGKEYELHMRDWNKQHAVLRTLLSDESYGEAGPVFLEHHATVHAAGLDRSVRWSFQDDVLSGLTDDQMRRIPKGRPHSVIWSLWHITRIEDVTMNILLADSEQVLVSGKWPARLGVADCRVGNELDQEGIANLSSSVDVNALLAYRRAVGKRTRALARRFKPEVLATRPAPERLQRLVAEQAVCANTAWLLDYWGGREGANLLLMPATRHPLVHLNEIRRMRAKLS